MRRAPGETLAAESLKSFPGAQHFAWLVVTHCWRHEVFMPGFCRLILCPFTIINLSHEHGYVLSPVSPPSRSLT